jgi:glycosyltransferase involved in cell wall biosynthesis
VINIHDGRNYLARTMRSLEHAAVEARRHDLSIELLFVLDRSPQSTVEWVEAYRSDDFDVIRYERVDNGSLGLSRQSGLDLASGEYVQFCDEDDLMSPNTTVVSLEQVRAEGRRAIAIPEYLFGFGSLYLLAHYASSDLVPPLAFISRHPFVSRLFLHRSVRQDLQFSNVPLGAGYAYEDWHFNATAVAKGYRFIPAAGTILFYRHRSSSLLHGMNATSVRQIPPSALFDPVTYIKICRSSYWGLRKGERPQINTAEMFKNFKDDSSIQTMVAAANEIEPAISLIKLEGAPLISNLAGDLTLGQAYYKACKIVMTERFDHVIVAGSAEGFEAFRSAFVPGPYPHAGSTLVLLDGGPFPRKFAAGLPNSTLIDLRSLAPGLTDDDVDALCLRVLETTCEGATVHLTPATLSYRITRKFARLLASSKFVFYRSGEKPEEPLMSAAAAEEFEFLSEFVDILHLVICPDPGVARHDRERIDRHAAKWVAGREESVASQVI